HRVARETVTVQRVIDRLPFVLTALLAVGIALGLSAWAGAFRSTRPSTGDVASALRSVLGANEVVECERRAQHYTCLTADRSGRSVVQYEAFLGQAASTDRIAVSAFGDPPRTDTGESCSANHIITAVSEAELREL